MKPNKMEQPGHTKLENILDQRAFLKDLGIPDFRLNDTAIVYNLLRDHAVLDTLSKYATETSQIVARRLANFACHTMGKDIVTKVAEIMSLDEIVHTVGKYEGETAANVIRGLADVAYCRGEKDAVMKVAETVGKYEGEAAGNVALRLADVAYGTGDKDVVIAACRIVDRAGSGMFDLLGPGDIAKVHREGLDMLIEDRKSFDAVAAYIEANGELPAPSRKNIRDYGKIISGVVSERYGITKELNNDQVPMLFSVEKSVRETLAGLVNGSVKKSPRRYSLSRGVDDTSLNYSREDLIEYSVISLLGSMDAKREKRAVEAVSRIVGRKVVDTARNAFNSRHKNLRSVIFGSLRIGGMEKAYETMKSRISEESIRDVLNAADYKDVSASGSNVLTAVESKNPLDYDRRVQIACVYLPQSSYESADILKYAEDSRFMLVRYDICGRPVGSAICHREGDTLLGDAVAGHRTFQKPQIFDAVYSDLLARAKEQGAASVIFNSDAGNATPRSFLKHLESMGLKAGRKKMNLDTEGYLEADEEEVKGYVVVV